MVAKPSRTRMWWDHAVVAQWQAGLGSIKRRRRGPVATIAKHGAPGDFMIVVTAWGGWVIFCPQRPSEGRRLASSETM